MRHTKLSAFSALVWLGLCIGCSSAVEKPKIDEKVSDTASRNVNSPKRDSHYGKMPTASDSARMSVRPIIERPPQNLPNKPKPLPPRIYDRMTQRIVDSLGATPGALLALHPQDRALAERYAGMRKMLPPLHDPKTGKPLPFPYAYPSRYAADIRRLDSLKKIQQADSAVRK